jgi:nitroreductase
METINAIMTRRSIRAFTGDPISKDTLDVLLSAAVAAPSGGNRQPWTFIVLCNQKRLKALRSLAPGMIDMPAAVVALCLDIPRATIKEKGDIDEMAWLDLGAAMQNILLAAHDLNLGACPVGSFHEQGVSALLNLPPHLKLALLIAIGIPAIKPAAPIKRPFEEVVFFEEYGGNGGSRDA